LKLPDILKRNEAFLLPACLFVLTIVSRIPFTSKYLYHMDSVQFALALDKFDVTIHQPHPPGYFLYVMLGRLLHLFINDANMVFVTISIFFSGLTVVAVYLLGKEMFEQKIGLLAALIAMTSPSLWFHGEVALAYVVEAFFSTIIALFCWKIYKGEHQYIWISAIALAVAGGIRQNTLVFLLPLLLFSVRRVRWQNIIASLGLMCLATLSWFVPMIIMTGGLNAYLDALRELWLFNTGNNTVFDQGWPVFKYYSSTVFDFTFYGIGAGLFVIILALYSLARNGKWDSLDKPAILFFTFWVLPSIFFYLLIFIHPANPGYALVYLPAFFIIAAISVIHLTGEFKAITGYDLAIFIISTLVAINTSIFFLSKYPVSYRKIKANEIILTAVLKDLKTLDPSKTAIFTGPYIFWGYRQIMYYLPGYRVYQMDFKKAPSGEVRKIFWGLDRKTFFTKNIVLPRKEVNFAIVLTSEDRKKLSGIRGLNVRQVLQGMSVVTGPAPLLGRIYPWLNFSCREG
jgi:hypothetical protein